MTSVKIGVNMWVWSAPVTTAELEIYAPKVKQMGFDQIEIPLETLGDLDYKRGAQIIRDNGLSVSTCAAMGPDRDLVLPETQANGMEYIRRSIEATQQLGATNFVS